MIQRPRNLDELCGNCGLTLGSHCGTSYYSEHYKMYISRNYCPGDEGRMNWDKGPGTTFQASGKYKEFKDAWNTEVKDAPISSKTPEV